VVWLWTVPVIVPAAASRIAKTAKIAKVAIIAKIAGIAKIETTFQI
jgi:hypothetical protein